MIYSFPQHSNAYRFLFIEYHEKSAGDIPTLEYNIMLQIPLYLTTQIGEAPVGAGHSHGKKGDDDHQKNCSFIIDDLICQEVGYEKLNSKSYYHKGPQSEDHLIAYQPEKKMKYK